MSAEIAKEAGMPDAASLIREKAVLENMRIMVGRNLEELTAAKYLLNKLFVATTQLILNRINNDIRNVQREMRKQNIKILGEEQVDNVLYYRYSCRGYEDKLGLMREVLRGEISSRLGTYVRMLINGGDNNANGSGKETAGHTAQ